MSISLAGNPLLNEKSYNNFNSHNNAGHNSNGLHNSGSSVPLYRRQPMTGNGGNSYNNMPGLFAGLDTGTNLIEALFQANNVVAEHSNKSDHGHGLLYNNYNTLKSGHDLDLFAAVPPQTAQASADTANHQQSSATTYAAVLSQGPQAAAGHQQQQQPAMNSARPLHASKSSQPPNDLEKDPFAAIRELGQATSGFYNYFQ